MKKLSTEAIESIKSNGGKVSYGLNLEKKPKQAEKTIEKKSEPIDLGKVIGEINKKNQDLVRNFLQEISGIIGINNDIAIKIAEKLKEIEAKKASKWRVQVTDRKQGKVDTIEIEVIE